MEVDVSAAERSGDRGNRQRTYPVGGGSGSADIEEQAIRLAPFDGIMGSEVILVEQRAPSGWNGGFNNRGFVQFGTADISAAVTPGSSMSGFTIQTSRPPTIREVSIVPNWILIVEDHDDVSDQMLADAVAVERSLPISAFALGPLEIEIGGNPHFGSLRQDLAIAESIGWVSNESLVDSLQTNLSAVQTFVFEGNNGLAIAELENMLALIGAADPSTFNQAVHDLVVLNVESMIVRLPNSRNTFIPVFTATPQSAVLELESTFTLTMQHFNSALDGNPPIENLLVLVRCVENMSCANASQLIPGTAFRIDETDEQLFSYVGQNVGVDVIEVVEDDFEDFRRLALIEVAWTAEADLIVPTFVPPLILAAEGDTIFVSDRTSNIGKIDVIAPTSTIYYISGNDPIDINDAEILGERIVPPLATGEISDSIEMEFVIPQRLTGEVQFLAACADGDDDIVESDEGNNCSFTEIVRELEAVGVVEDPNANTPPVASGLSNVTDGNTAVGITLAGTDDDRDTLTFTVQTNPSSGNLLGTAPNLTYTPNIGFVGTDSFTFIVNAIICDDDDDSDSDSDSDSDGDVCKDNDDDSDSDSDD